MTEKEDLSVEKTEWGTFYVADENYNEFTGNPHDTYAEAEKELRELYNEMAAAEAYYLDEDDDAHVTEASTPTDESTPSP